MVTYQVDMADNRDVDIRQIITDKTAPNANLLWNRTDCDRKPTAPIWGTAMPADCSVSVDLSMISEDIVAWSIVITNVNADVLVQTGSSSEFDGIQPNTFVAEGIPGVWIATVELEDAAGNRQRFEIATDLTAPEATAGEQLKTPGSGHNIVIIIIIVALLAILQMFIKSRKPKDGDSQGESWPAASSQYSTELSDSDSMFEDDIVVSNEEATPSNAE
jgi:hypothetical protein